ncbi:MAG TPA: TetR/AcrR family transcriptional regulator [Bryobacteraceae bacterium]|nr:TetR/AcrR family transcriptional regulator [Bryobacteraceae bacterium]
MKVASNGETPEIRGPGRPRDEEARQRILTAALEVLEKQGFRGATMEAIAEQAGASKATVYRWWPNKASVLTEAFREAGSLEFAFPDTGSLRNDIHVALRRFAAYLRTRRGRLLAALVAGAQDDDEIATALRELWIAPLRARSRKILGRYRASGELAVEVDLAQDLIYAPFYYQLLTAYKPLTPAYADSIADAVLGGVMRQAPQKQV